MIDPARIEFDRDEDDDDTPGVTAAQVKKWERRHKVTLPPMLRQVLSLQDGGALKHAAISIQPLDEIEPVDEDFWEYVSDDHEFADRGLVFALGDNAYGGRILMDYNVRGRSGEPGLLVYFSDNDGPEPLADSFEAFLEEELATDEEPTVDWSEAAGVTDAIARVTVDLSEDDDQASLEQVLWRSGDSLVFLTREETPEGLTLSRVVLPTPIDPDQAAMLPPNPPPGMICTLQIQPKQTDGIRHVDSTRVGDFGWKNSSNDGVPFFANFRSDDLPRLHALRAELIGAEAAAEILDREQKQAAFQSHLESLSPQARTAAMMQHALERKAALEAEFAGQIGSLGPMPPELAEASAAIRQRLAEAVARAQGQIAASPPDAETMRRIAEMLHPPARDEPPDRPSR